MPDGLDSLLATLEQAGSEGMTLAGENVGIALRGLKEHGVDFERAWSMTINRLQPSQIGRVVDGDLDLALREDRALLEENRPFFQADYEGRRITPRERASSVVRAWRRLDGTAG